jgi:hypothetical protein
MFMMLYYLWRARNDARETQKLQDLKAVAMKIVVAVEEWRNIHVNPPNLSNKKVEHWLPPDQLWCKVNTDGAFRQTEGNERGRGH